MNNNGLWEYYLNLLNYEPNNHNFIGYNQGEYFLIILNMFSLIAALSVVITINPVISVFFLIVLYISVALFIYLTGIIFIGLTYIIVYVGAIAILFLFIIMIIDIELSEITTKSKMNINNNNLIFFLSFIFLFPFLSLITNKNNYYNNDLNYFNINYSLNDYFIYFLENWEPNQLMSSQVTGLGNILYSNQAILIFILSIILLLSMVGAIILTLDYKENVYMDNNSILITDNNLKLNKYTNNYNLKNNLIISQHYELVTKKN